VGLDGSRPHRDTLDVQAQVLHEILDACAAEGGRTISLHSRGAAAMLLDMLEFEPLAGRFVLHWFSSSPALVERAAALGCWFSINSAMMRSGSGRRSIEAMPCDRMLPETDGPFGTLDFAVPPPGGGGALYHELADLRGGAASLWERLMTENFRRIVALSAIEGRG
jgi:TatD DNase family protein